eukprot:TRINITY_DN31633_c0_g1_i1.p1 TRINITY_DN31633_c0_g1~~TRINITY_DN31633_c0_g1_i1.p1  ORF type:complete len:286 (-),score=58.85 TRINITY_DN31633_c0_g1_i1:117-974(-)
MEQTPLKASSSREDRQETPEKVSCDEEQSMLDLENDCSDDERHESDEDDEDEKLYEEFRSAPLPTPNTVKSRIRKLIADYGLKVKDIQALIGEGPGPAWNKFMNGKYKDQSWACSNDAFQKAAFFLYKEKRLGSKGKIAALKKKTSKLALPDLSAIETDGKTYLTPGECRKSVQAILKKYTLTQGKVAKMIGENPVMLGRFLADGGEFGGSEKACYRAVAEFCEKVRMATGGKKSRKRLAIEAEGEDQPYLGTDASKRFLVPAGTSLYRTRDEIGRQVVKCRRVG